MSDPQDFGEYDYVIVGAGTAGCLLANRLSADPGTTVLLLEAGKSENYHWVHIPVGYLYCIGNPRTDWGYRTAPEPGLGGRSILYPRGKLLGGCSSINGMLYQRGQRQDYDTWAQMGLTGWGWDDVLPYFLMHEDHHGGDSEHHRAGGEWRVEKQRLHWDILDVIRDACVEAGIPFQPDFNQGDNEGVSYFEVNQKNGWRWTTAGGFLRPVMKRPNLRVLTEAQAMRLDFTEGRATGVIFHQKGPARARARREVILAAGAIGSPQILQLSGVGPGPLLQRMGIAPVLEQPEVGANLQDHLQLRLIYRVRNALTLNQRAGSLWGKAGIALEYALKRTGPMSMAPSQLCAYTRSSPDVATPDLEYHIQPLSLEAFGQPLHDFPAVTMSVCNLRPESRGRVEIASPDWRDHPVIAPNYLSTESDRLTAARSIRVTRRIMEAPALAPHAPEEVKPGPGPDDDAALAKAASDIGTTIFHPVGTVRMGVDAAAPLDGRMRFNGIGGLRVVDASAMPRITSGNTNSPVLMMAEKAAEMILGDARR